jgi:predicted glycogen debranching enzyme
MFFGKSYWKTQEQGIQREWLLTNGIGGFSCGSIIGMNARRYHGLLIASLMPPVERYLILSAISESIHFGRGNDVPKTGEESDLSQEYNQVYYLHAFRTHNFKAHGEYHLESFYYDTVPTFSYRIGSMIIEKSICLRRGMNQVVVVYRIKNQKRRAVVRLTPLVNYRNYHHLSSHSYMTFSTRAAGSKMEITPYDEKRRIFIECSEGKAVIQDKCFFYNMDYPYEHERGLNGTEDHYIPGYFEIGLMPAEEKCITFVCSVDVPIDTLDGEALIRQEAERQKSLMQYQDPGRFQHKAGSEKPDPFLQRLLLAADDFIVYRKSTDSKTIIAGYPWFTDWGRDTMIALPGLTLATKRFEDARNILYTFARYEKYGLIPNVFPDGDGDPAYNTVDAPLWYFDAVYKYIQYTDDIRFVKEQLFDVLERIIHGYIKGTLYQIKMDKDYLIQAGNEDTQLTWMDAKAGNWVVTPRHGKAVEINALWYNALMVMGYYTDLNSPFYLVIVYRSGNDYSRVAASFIEQGLAAVLQSVCTASLKWPEPPAAFEA